MGYLARCGGEEHAVMRRAIIMGSVLASYAVEQFSLERLKTLTRDEIGERYAAFRRLTHFEELEPELFAAR
jgi:hypothetical protein